MAKLLTDNGHVIRTIVHDPGELQPVSALDVDRYRHAAGLVDSAYTEYLASFGLTRDDVQREHLHAFLDFTRALLTFG